MGKKQVLEKKRQRIEQQKKERQSRAERGKLRIRALALLALCLVAVLLFFTHFADIYNSDIAGCEVSVNGFSFAIAGATKDFMSADQIYGNLAVPFYYYAGDLCAPLATAALLALVVVVVAALLHGVTAAAGCFVLQIPCAVADGVAAGFLIRCFALGISMKNSQILPIYCSGNPACSVRTFAILPALVLVCAAAVDIYGFVRGLLVYQRTKTSD